MQKKTVFTLILACILLSSCGVPSRRSVAYTPESIDLGGEGFTVLCADSGSYNDSVMNKNDFEEFAYHTYNSLASAGEAFNTSIEIKNINPQTAINDLKLSVLSAEHLYDVVMLPIIDTMRFAYEGYFIDLNTAGIDLSSVWWHAHDDGLTLGNRRYAVYSDLTLTGFFESRVTAINDNALADEIVKLANGGGFTLDVMNEYIKNAGASMPYDPLTLVFATGESFFINDGELTIPQFSERMSESLTKIRSMYESGTDGASELFSVCEYKLLDGRRFVPLPKLDEAQEHYITAMSDDAVVSSIPITSSDPHAAMCVLDMLTYLMWRDAVPAFLDTADSDGMLALIDQNRRVDYLTVLPIESKPSLVSELITAALSGTGEISDIFYKYEASMKDELSTLISSLPH